MGEEGRGDEGFGDAATGPPHVGLTQRLRTPSHATFETPCQSFNSRLRIWICPAW
jgi:hypothetical protein